ncbi:hypothetical protein K431DRAFT_295649 [Polychaeton citri CBS 116435]|uniref:F-box domain-containing protein n=1 Tax=Polychaeton citri CBS 116435 TaxID=1314669 RepID=A0A9P4UL66_9PEZI|nr:hypothetical protein K431DRAFT_295649 [Polychaeton citri CBS 116435]
MRLFKTTTTSASPLLRLPPELRAKILSYSMCHRIPTNLAFSIKGNNHLPNFLVGSNEGYGGNPTCNFPYALTQVCRQLRHDALRAFFSTHQIELGLWRENRWQPAVDWLQGILSLPTPSEEEAALRNARDWIVTLENWMEGYFSFRIFAPWEVADESAAAEVKDRATREMTWSFYPEPSGSRRRKVTRVGRRFVMMYETSKGAMPSGDRAFEFLDERLSLSGSVRGIDEGSGVEGLGAQDALDLVSLFVTRTESTDEILEESWLDMFR